MYLKKLYSLCIFLAVSTTSLQLWASPSLSRVDYKPIALVNDVSITPYDLTKRIKLLRFLNNTPADAVVTAQDRAALLRNVIDEIVKAQETQRFDVTISPERLDGYIQGLARQKGMTKEAFFAALEKNGVQRSEVEKIFSRQQAWTDLVRGRYGRDVSVNTHEVAQLVEGTLKVGDMQVRYDVISLPFRHVGEIRTKLQEAENIQKRLQSGEDFNAIKTSYQSSIASDNSLVSLAQAPQYYHSFLMSAEEGDISSAIQTQTSIDLVKFYERQSTSGITFDPEVKIKQGTLLKGGRSDQELKAILDNALSVSDPCENYDVYFEGIKDYPLQKISQYPEMLQKNARTMKVGASKIIRITNDAVNVVSVCQKKKIDYYNDIPVNMRSNIQKRLKDHKLFLKEKEYLRSLRENAVIHILDMNL